MAPLEGVVLTRISGKWSALYLISDVYVDIKGAYVKQLKAPKSGWDPFWQKLSEADIATLPDPSQINCENGGIDGMSYVVEINQNYAYRAYKYETSYPSKCEEVQKMKQIGRIIANEFYDGKQECINARWFPCVAKYGVENDL